MLDAERYVRTETKFSMMGSVCVTILFYTLAFGVLEPVPIKGFGRYAFDFLPQSFMTALICTWLPGAITRKRAKAGAVTPFSPAIQAQSSLILTGLGFALASLILGIALAGTLYLSNVQTIDWTLGLIAKAAFAAIIAAMVTPATLRKVLGAGPQHG